MKRQKRCGQNSRRNVGAAITVSKATVAPKISRSDENHFTPNQTAQEASS